MEPIYLDYNATTPVDSQVARAMQPYLTELFGNPSSMHSYGIRTKQAVMQARRQIAALLNCRPEEVVFTSGGTESNNYAIKGAALAQRTRGRHIITSRVEHPAVTEVCSYLERAGFEVTWLEVDSYGRVDVRDVEKAIRPDTILITIMHANNEVGTLQPVEAIGRLAKERGILFHSDAAQSVGKVPVDVEAMQVDLLSVAGHKLYAPKGIGALYIRRGVTLEKLIHGADHEMNLRAGTENVLEIVGLGKACELAAAAPEDHTERMRELRDALQQGILDRLPQARVNGHPEARLPNTLSISFPGVEANTLLAGLPGVAASAGAACHTDSIDVSPVLRAMRVPEEYAMGTVRFSVGRYTTRKEVEAAIDQVTGAVQRLSGDREAADRVAGAADVKLTQYTHGMGCACKIRPQYLEAILKDLPIPSDPNVLVSLATSDDAAVYRLSDTTAVIQTVDFFTPIVDDPYQFGAIAAANALSDVYAMGGKPLFALNIVGFPDARLPAEVLRDILKGASDKAAEAGIPILGGHTVEDTEPKFGMTVTGIVHPGRIMRNDTPEPGDALVLTKPIGTGLVATAMKRGVADAPAAGAAIRAMASLNKAAADVMAGFDVHACTDVTGFGLLGHLLEMVRSSGMQANLEFDAIPLLPGAMQFAADNIVPGGTVNNKAYVAPFVEYGPAMSEVLKTLVNDAQTSGGLLMALPWDLKDDLVEALRAQGVEDAACIGRIGGPGVGKIFIG